MASKHNVPLAAMERLMKQAGADRVSEDAKAALREALEEHAAKICAAANTLAAHARRKTIKAEDINLAVKQGV